MVTFLCRLETSSIRRGAADEVGWKKFMYEKFSVKSFYSSLDNGRREPFPTSIVWNHWVPMEVGYLAREATCEWILTNDQLKRKEWIMPNRCYKCKYEESIDHMLQLVFFPFGVAYMMNSTAKRTLLRRHESFVKRKKAWILSKKNKKKGKKLGGSYTCTYFGLL